MCVATAIPFSYFRNYETKSWVHTVGMALSCSYAEAQAKVNEKTKKLFQQKFSANGMRQTHQMYVRCNICANGRRNKHFFFVRLSHSLHLCHLILSIASLWYAMFFFLLFIRLVRSLQYTFSHFFYVSRIVFVFFFSFAVTPFPFILCFFLFFLFLCVACSLCLHVWVYLLAFLAVLSYFSAA